jgi:ribosomal protein S6
MNEEETPNRMTSPASAPGPGGSLNHYEIALVINPDVPEKEVEKIAEETRELLGGMQATIAGTRIERRSLAYPIKKWTEAHYVYIECDAPGTMPQTIRHEMKHREGLVRMAFVRKAIQPEAPAPTPAPEPVAAQPEPVAPPAEPVAAQPEPVAPEPVQPSPEADNA